MPNAFLLISASLAALLAGAFFAEPASFAAPPTLGESQKATLERYARDTWRSVAAMAQPGGLPADGLKRSPDGAWLPTGKTSPTDIAAYLWSILAAERLGLIDPAEANHRLDRTLGALARLDRAHGFFFNQYDPRTAETYGSFVAGGGPRPFLSTVDNGWLAAALIMVGNTHPEYRARAEEILKPMDFGFFFEPYNPAEPFKHPAQFRGGIFLDDHSTNPFYGMLNTEPRMVSYIAIARGQVPAEHYYRLYRTLPPGYARQQQTPQGVIRTYRGIDVFEGYYVYRRFRVVPSWGGSMFEALMVPLFVPEERWAPRSWGINHPLYVRAQIEQGLKIRRYGAWGFSPACNPDGGYRAYGVDDLGTEIEGYHTHNDNAPDDSTPTPRDGPVPNGVVTPHASFLALTFAPREALANLETLVARYSIYSHYGFLDSVNVRTGAVSNCILVLDQGMIMAAIANAVADEALRHAFSDGAIESAIRPLIAPEEFSAGAGPP
jgi:hypothetical protein